tara:strand:- start:120 stop:272 length:153 start_codon:yes stop_codon:yes gene_type:complete
MKSNKMMEKMAIMCRVLNDVLRDSQKYNKLKRNYDELEKCGKIHKTYTQV